MTDRILPAIGRIVAFTALLFVCGSASYILFAPLAAKVISSTGQPLKLDVFANVIAVFVATALMLRSLDRRPWSAVDLDAPAAKPALLARGFMLGAGAIGLVVAALLLAGLLEIKYAPDGGSWLSAA